MKDLNKKRQESEDLKIKRYIQSEATKIIREMESGNKTAFRVYSPIPKYVVYDEETAMYQDNGRVLMYKQINDEISKRLGECSSCKSKQKDDKDYPIKTAGIKRMCSKGLDNQCNCCLHCEFICNT